MKKLDMSSYGVEELDANEMKNLDGGVILALASLATVLGVGLMKVISTGVLVTGATGGIMESLMAAVSGIIIA